ncbi:MAG: DivIVA domain-containing protein [Solirubrobacteraceae bacterium]
MTLTPQHVRNKLFTSVRFRQGYDEDEVDAFLDEVESELTRLLSEIEQLKAGQGPVTDPQLVAVKADADARLQRMLDEAREQHEREVAALRAEHAQALARGQAGEPGGAPSPEVEAVRREADALVARANEQARLAQAQVQDLAVRLEHAQQQAEAATRRAQAAGTEIARRGADETQESEAAPGQLVASSPTEDALRRTLVLAQRTADEAIAEARAEAQRIVTEAHRHAADTISRVEVEHSAIVQRRTAEQQQLLAKLDELRSFERDYRSRLRAYLHLQLRDLEAGAPEPPRAQVAGGPRQALASGPRPEDAPPSPEIPLRPPPLYGVRPVAGGDG